MRDPIAKLTVGLDRTVGHAVYRLHLLLYRSTKGVIGHRTPLGPVLLLVTIGRKSALTRTAPLLYFEREGQFFVVASNGGRHEYPNWFLNVRANGRVSVRVGPREFSTVARIAGDAERSELWPALVSFYPGWGHYATLTPRPLEVVILDPSIYIG